MERSAAYIEISQRPDGHTLIRIPEGDDVREFDLGFAPALEDFLGATALFPLIRRAFEAGFGHGVYKTVERALPLPKWLKRKLKESK